MDPHQPTVGIKNNPFQDPSPAQQVSNCPLLPNLQNNSCTGKEEIRPQTSSPKDTPFLWPKHLSSNHQIIEESRQGSINKFSNPENGYKTSDDESNCEDEPLLKTWKPSPTQCLIRQIRVWTFSDSPSLVHSSRNILTPSTKPPVGSAKRPTCFCNSYPVTGERLEMPCPMRISVEIVVKSPCLQPVQADRARSQSGENLYRVHVRSTLLGTKAAPEQIPHRRL